MCNHPFSPPSSVSNTSSHTITTSSHSPMESINTENDEILDVDKVFDTLGDMGDLYGWDTGSNTLNNDTNSLQEVPKGKYTLIYAIMCNI